MDYNGPSFTNRIVSFVEVHSHHYNDSNGNSINNMTTSVSNKYIYTYNFICVNTPKMWSQKFAIYIDITSYILLYIRIVQVGTCTYVSVIWGIRIYNKHPDARYITSKVTHIDIVLY